jgi:hypothetical protein
MPLTRQAKAFFIALLVLIITACSFKTLYNQLDYLIPSYLEGLVSLDDVLEKKVEQRSQLVINWHRNTQLKQYADWLRTLQHDVGPQLTEAQLLQHIATLDFFWQSLLEKVNEEMAGLLPLLNSEQRKELFASIADKNQDFSDDYIEPDEAERIDSFTESMLDNYENWLGELTEKQEKAIELAASELRSTAALRLQQRLLWQQGIQDILDGSATAALKSERLSLFFSDFEIENNAEMKATGAANQRIIVQLTVQIVHNLRPEQKDYFIDKTDDYIRIFTELAENR